MSGPDWDQIGASTYTYAGDAHPDQLSGNQGIIRNIRVEEVSPSRHIRRSAWLVPPAGQHVAPIDERVALFDPKPPSPPRTNKPRTSTARVDDHHRPPRRPPDRMGG